MRVTRQTNHAIRLLMYCASNHSGLSRISDVACAYGVSELFLFKVLKPLVKAGLVATVRGRGGGIRLARPADRITLFDVIQVTEGGFAMAECFENAGADCPLIDNCALNAAWREALDAFLRVLARHTIADLCAKRFSVAGRLGLGDMAGGALAGHWPAHSKADRPTAS